MTPQTREPMERFREKTRRDPATGCLLWTGATSKGYGRFMVRRGEIVGAHRWIFWQDHGYLPEVVMHACDTPACVELTHLIPGTVADNVADKMTKGRHRFAVGEAAGAAKLSNSGVLEIRREHARGILTTAMLADVYGVTRDHVARIVRRKSRGYE